MRQSKCIGFTAMENKNITALLPNLAAILAQSSVDAEEPMDRYLHRSMK